MSMFDELVGKMLHPTRPLCRQDARTCLSGMAKTYIEDESELDIWSNDYFLQLADMIKFG